ncbi:Cell wall-associated hydrolases (invasion-associated protein), partial [human gut metagenome]
MLFSGGTQVSGQTMYSAEDRDIRGAEQDYKKLEKELDKKIKRTPTDHPGYNEYQYHLDPIEHDPWQLTSFLTTLYDDYTRSEVQGKLKETFTNETGNLQQLVHSAVNYTQHNANGYAADDEAGNSHCVSERTSYHCSNYHSRCAAEIEHTNCVGKAHCISQSCRDNGLRQNNLQRMEAVIIYAGS